MQSIAHSVKKHKTHISIFRKFVLFRLRSVGLHDVSSNCWGFIIEQKIHFDFRIYPSPCGNMNMWGFWKCICMKCWFHCSKYWNVRIFHWKKILIRLENFILHLGKFCEYSQFVFCLGFPIYFRGIKCQKKKLLWFYLYIRDWSVLLSRIDYIIYLGFAKVVIIRSLQLQTPWITILFPKKYLS